MTDQDVRPLLDQVADAISGALESVRPELRGSDPVVRRSEHADFQSNAALAHAKRAKTAPVELATGIVDALVGQTPGPIEAASPSGPGFLNITVPDRLIWNQVEGHLASPRLGVPTPAKDRRAVVDYSAPNIAKEMHVGHLRTTIIGDSLVRVLGFLGADVIRQNHLGDWGTQFGMLIQYLDEHPDIPWHRDQLGAATNAVSALDELYRTARNKFEADDAFADRSRQRVVALQAGDPTTLRRWRDIVAESEAAFHDIYRRLGVLLTTDDSAGESFYNDLLADVIDELVAKGVVVESDGALVIFSEEVDGPDGNPAPLIVRKRDGGYGYDTTDLATIRYSIQQHKADWLLYVTDARQSLHFRLIFEAARRAGWLTDDVDAAHVPFGTVLGPDGRPFKTRAGGTVRLMDLLDESVAKARQIVHEKNPDLPDQELDQIAESAGIGAVKYADLSTSRVKDYTFDVDRMISFNGNTGVYLQYAHTRIRSILRRAGDPDIGIDPAIALEPAERALALELDAYSTALTDVADTLEPHRLCGYLYDLARDFTTFYEQCHVLNADEPVRSNRLALCQLTARTLNHGLSMLGITAPARM